MNTGELPLLNETDEGVEVAIRAIPGSSVTKITGIRQGAVVIKVTTPPEKGKANLTISKVLSVTLGIPKSRILLIRGERNRDKIFLLSAVTPEEAREALTRF